MKNILHLALGLLLSVSLLHAHSDVFKPAFVDTLVQPYLSIEKGLAADDLAASQAGAAAFLKAMKAAPHEDEAHEEAMDLIQPAKVISGAADIQKARVAFLDLSKEMVSLVEHVGTTEDTPLYRVFCPMAFGRGGQWMQSEKTVSNPYFGTKMLRCGSIQKRIAGTEEHSDHADPSGHSH